MYKYVVYSMSYNDDTGVLDDMELLYVCDTEEIAQSLMAKEEAKGLWGIDYCVNKIKYICTL